VIYIRETGRKKGGENKAPARSVVRHVHGGGRRRGRKGSRVALGASIVLRKHDLEEGKRKTVGQFGLPCGKERKEKKT